MSAILLAAVPCFVLLLGYLFYSSKVAGWLGLDPKEKTPAHEFYDGVDYIPARHWTVLFGHHFASIAGAAPIIGPVIACLYWGWGPAVLWIVVGGVLFGGVHDLTALTLSAKHRGQSVAALTDSVLGKTAKGFFSIFAFLTLILIVAVFAAVAGKTLATTPKVVIPTFGLVVVALIVGFLMYKAKMHLLLCSVIGLALLFGLIVAGYYCPISLPLENAAKWWTVILLIYGLIASVTPVTVLLQPRDHLAAGVLFCGMFLGFLGLVITRPSVNAPCFVAFSTDKGYLWPIMFVTVACGALSGFHSLVAGGTTSKQLPRMRDARVIGYGAMIMECALAVLALVAVTAGLYWKEAREGIGEGLVYQEVFRKGGWIKAFGVGYGEIAKSLLGALGALIGITMLKTFVMTTLDSATRITRYICTEFFGETFGIGVLKNKYASTAFIGIFAGALALGNWKAIWPVFGSANQLIASLVFIVATVYLLIRRKKWLFTAVPGFLVLVTTLVALTFKSGEFLSGKEPKILLAVIACVLGALAIYMFIQAMVVIVRIRKNQVAEEEGP